MTSVVKLKCDDFKNGNWFHWIIENLILFKLQCFKNNPRGNNLVIRSFLISSLVPAYGLLIWYFMNLITNFCKCSNCLFFESVSSLCFTLESYKIYVLPYLAIIVIIYSSLWKDYHSKWEYCSHLFNDTLKSLNESEAHLLEASLAIDVLILDLWAHRSFRDLFYQALENAIKFKYKENHSIFLSTIVDRGELTEADAMSLLNLYQEHLVEIKEYKIKKKN